MKDRAGDCSFDACDSHATGRIVRNDLRIFDIVVNNRKAAIQKLNTIRFRGSRITFEV